MPHKLTYDAIALKTHSKVNDMYTDRVSVNDIAYWLNGFNKVGLKLQRKH